MRWAGPLLVLAVVAGCGTVKTAPTVATPPASPTTASAGATASGAGATAPSAGATASSATLTKAEFLSAADRICEDGHLELVSQQAKIDQALSADQASDTQGNRLALTDALRVDATLSRSLLARLSVPAAAAGSESSVSDYIAATEHQTSLIERFATAVAAGDASRLTVIARQLTRGKASLKELARGDGFKVCGTDS
jgi:hypothetical protein